MKRILFGGIVLAAVIGLGSIPAMARGYGGGHGESYHGREYHGDRGHEYREEHERREYRGGRFDGGFSYGFDFAPAYGYYGGDYAYPYYSAPDYCYPSFPGYYLGGYHYYRPHEHFYYRHWR